MKNKFRGISRITNNLIWFEDGQNVNCANFWDEAIKETIVQWTEFTTHGKKQDIYDGDRWVLCFYSKTANGWVTNQGTIEKDKNGMWICRESPGVNKFELLSMVEDYEDAFEIVKDYHGGRSKIDNDTGSSQQDPSQT